MRPAMLNNDNRPVKPPRSPRSHSTAPAVSWSNAAFTPMSRPPNTSCNKGRGHAQDADTGRHIQGQH